MIEIKHLLFTLRLLSFHFFHIVLFQYEGVSEHYFITIRTGPLLHLDILGIVILKHPLYIK